MGVYLCTERLGHLRHFEPPPDSPRMKNNESSLVSSNSQRVLADTPPVTLNKEERDEKCLVSRKNSERKPSIDSTGDEKHITMDRSVANEDLTIKTPVKNKKKVNIPTHGSDWMLVAGEGMDYQKLEKSPLKPLPDLGEIIWRKKRSSLEDEREMENMLTQVIHESKLDRSLLLEAPVQRDREISDSYTSSHT